MNQVILILIYILPSYLLFLEMFFKEYWYIYFQDNDDHLWQLFTSEDMIEGSATSLAYLFIVFRTHYNPASNKKTSFSGYKSLKRRKRGARMNKDVRMNLQKTLGNSPSATSPTCT